MNVLITGGAGFIGSNLVHYLAAERPTWNLTVVDKLTYAGNPENIGALLKNNRVKLVTADIADQSAMAELFAAANFGLVFHLAAESHVDRSIMSAHEFVHTNVLGTQVLVDCARRHGVGRFVHVSTDEVYGSLGATGRFLETTPLDPTSPYAASKAASDLMVLAAWKTHRFPAVVTRCTNNYGPYQFPEKFIPLAVSNALEGKPLPIYGDGLNVRNWIYVLDHAAALLVVAERGQLGEVYNIGGGEETELPNRHVAEEILRLTGQPLSLLQFVKDRPAHDVRYAIDHTKMTNALGWRPTQNFSSGLSQTVEWYRANGAWLDRVKSGAYRQYMQANYSWRAA